MTTRTFFPNFPGALALMVHCACGNLTRTTLAADTNPAPAQAAAPTNAAPDLEALLKAAAAAKPATAVAGEGWTPLFNGRDLEGWKLTSFVGRGKVRCVSGMLVFEEGHDLTGVTWTNPVIKMSYEVTLEAMRVEGSDFFCGLTVPVGEAFCSLILGGWGGSLVGISSIDGLNASENETSDFIEFDAGRWYRVRMRITPGKIEAWLDDKQIANVKIGDREITVRAGEIEFSKPLGLASYQTTAALRDVKIRKLDAATAAPAEKK